MHIGINYPRTDRNSSNFQTTDFSACAGW